VLIQVPVTLPTFFCRSSHSTLDFLQQLRLHDLKWTIEIICYRGLHTVASPIPGRLPVYLCSLWRWRKNAPRGPTCHREEVESGHRKKRKVTRLQKNDGANALYGWAQGLAWVAGTHWVGRWTTPPRINRRPEFFILRICCTCRWYVDEANSIF
jgi:hypothetical protein